MSPPQQTGATKDSRSDRLLTASLAAAFCTPFHVVGKTESSLSSYAVFLSVAAHEGRTQVEIASDTGLSAKTVSRVITHIGTAHGGLGWIRQVVDEDDRRLRRLYLSRKGKTLVTRMLKDVRRKASSGQG